MLTQGVPFADEPLPECLEEQEDATTIRQAVESANKASTSEELGSMIATTRSGRKVARPSNYGSMC